MAERVRQFFDSVQLATESGGRQLDDKGKPLVGRYRDGTTPAAGKEAYGAGQMQIGTAKNVAAAHGIPWDEKKFLYDKDYNLNLADTHMADLTKKYGDKTLARAAYHSGEPNVDRAVAKYGRAGFAQGLGPEGRKYIQMGSGGTKYSATTPGRGVADPMKYLEGLQSTLAPETESSGNVRVQADKIFNSGPEMDKRGAALEGELGNQAGAIDVLSQTTDALQAVQTASMETKVEETRAISNEIVQGTQELKAQVKPVFEARNRIANQLDELNTMNPLERGLRGIFDLNYDRKYLEGQLDHYDRTLKARSDDFNYLNTLHTTAMTEVARRYDLDSAVPGLAQEQAKEDLGIVGMRIQQTAASLGSLKDQITGQSQLLAAQAGARSDLLGQLDTPTINKYMAQAQANNGPVKIGDVSVSYNELREMSQARENQLLQVEGVRNSIANGRMDFAEKYAGNLARSLTRQQTEEAMRNNGVYNGPDGPIQLDQTILADVYKTHLQRDGLLAEATANNIPASLALKTGSEAMNATGSLYARTRSFYGPQDQGASATIRGEVADSVRALSEATRNGSAPEVITALTQKVAMAQGKMSKFTDEVILRKVGGDQKAAGYLKAFTYGTPLGQGTAVEAMTYFALKGNLPTGMAMSPESKQIFKEAQRLVETKRNTVNPNTNKPWKTGELEKAVAGDLSTFAQATVGQARMNLIQNDLPRVAQMVQSPLGKVRPEDWRRISTMAKSEGIKAIIPLVGMSAQDIRQMEVTGRPINDTPEAAEAFKKFQANAGTMNETENRVLSHELDGLPQVTTGRRNSSVYLDLLNSPKMSNFIANYSQSRGAESLGDYLVGPLSGGALETNVARHAEDFQNVRDGQYEKQRQLARTQPAGMLMNPGGRAAVILSSMPGLGSEGARALMPVVGKILKDYAASGQHPDTGGIPSFANAMRQQDDAILMGLKSQKFQDPRLETYRKQAVQNWGNHATQTQGTIDGLISTMQTFMATGGPVAETMGEIRQLGAMFNMGN